MQSSLDYCTSVQLRKRARNLARERGYVIGVPRKPSGAPDFEAAGVLRDFNNLPEDMWLLTDRQQFAWLDLQLPGGTRPSGYTWHHSEIPGRMELVPFGIHRSISHKGGRSPGSWAHAPRN